MINNYWQHAYTICYSYQSLSSILNHRDALLDSRNRQQHCLPHLLLGLEVRQIDSIEARMRKYSFLVAPLPNLQIHLPQTISWHFGNARPMMHEVDALLSTQFLHDFPE